MAVANANVHFILLSRMNRIELHLCPVAWESYRPRSFLTVHFNQAPVPMHADKVKLLLKKNERLSRGPWVISTYNSLL